jgi:hypothetical protein
MSYCKGDVSEGFCEECFSVNPKAALELIRQGGVIITPSDNNYCCAINGIPLRFTHFTKEQQVEFTDLYNSTVFKMDLPGFFPVKPFFWK